MDLSIIIFNYKTPKLTYDCIQSIHRVLSTENLTYEVILIDNHSDDGNIDILKDMDDGRTHVFETSKNGGFGYGNNRGVEKSSGDYLFFLNSDTILYPDTLSKMITYIQTHGNVGIMSCLMRNGDNNSLVSAHQFENTKSLFVQTIIKPLIPKSIIKKRGEYFTGSQSEIVKCDWVSGAAILMPRKVFDEVGGWNEKYFLYMEDEELCYRVHNKGYEVLLYPEFGLQHLVSQSGGSAFSAYERYKSKLMFFYDTDRNHFNFDKVLLFIQAKQYMHNLSKKEKLEVIRKLKELNYE